MRLNILCAFSCKLAIALLLTGCTEEERLFGPGEDTLRISATITPSAATRMQMGDKGNEQFQPGDRISLQVTPQDLHLGVYHIPYNLRPTGGCQRLPGRKLEVRVPASPPFILHSLLKMQKHLPTPWQ